MGEGEVVSEEGGGRLDEVWDAAWGGDVDEAGWEGTRGGKGVAVRVVGGAVEEPGFDEGYC